jgi:gliding motility-associated-like protein
MHRSFARHYVFIFSLCLINLTAVSQQSNIWYFGEYCGINFNNNPPTALLDGQINTYEGCAVISDQHGDLRFYTDGRTVYNRLHGVMPNGTGLLGGGSSTSSAIVIPMPGSDHLFYVFTAEEINPTLNTRYAYSVIDINLDGGLGDVIVAQKNIILYAPGTERLAAVKHANGIDYWIITKTFGDNRFRVYKLTCTGLDPVPVISSIGAVPVAMYDALGAMKVSPDGKKLGIAIYGMSKGQLFDFDIATGIVSNKMDLTGYATNRIYGVEFSSNSKLLYISTTLNIINQYDVYAGDETAVNASKYVITTPGGQPNAAMQLGPGNKIYVAVFGQAAINVINDPDVQGAGCNMDPSAILLGGRTCRWGLPSFNSSFFNTATQADFTQSFTNCQVHFEGSTNITGTVDWFWDFGDGNTGTGQIIDHIYTSTGNFNVTLKVKPVGTCVTADSFLVSHNVLIKQDTSHKVNFSHSFSNCQVQFSGTTDFAEPVNWLWDFGDGNTGTGQNVNHVYAQHGTYTVTLRGEPVVSCVIYDTMVLSKQVVIEDPGNNIDFSHAFTNCEVHFAATTNSVAPLVWQWDFGDGSAGSGENADHVYAASGLYQVVLKGIRVTNCPLNDTLVLTRPVPITINNVTVNAGIDTTIFYNLPFQLHAIATPATASYTWSPVTGLDDPFIASPVTVLKKDIKYFVTVIDENGCTATDDINIKVFGNPEVYVPNAFTPNGDSKNDILKPLGFGIRSVEYFRIYNRFGQLVFHTNTLGVGWDGNFGGKPQPADTYTYMVKVINYRGWPVEQKGTTTIIR